MKTLRIKIVANNCNWQNWPEQLDTLKKWFAPKLTVEFELVHTSFKNVPFINYPNNTNGRPDMDGVEPIWYDNNITLPYGMGYDMVMLVMNVAEWKGKSARGWRTDKDQGPVQLQVAADEKEGIWVAGVFAGSTFFNYGRHEIMHGLFMLTGQPDTTHFWWDQGMDKLVNALNEVKFPEPKTPETPTTTTQDVMTIAFTWLTKVLNWLKGGQVGQMPPLPPELMDQKPKATFDQFCKAIQGMEGYYAPGENKNYPNGTRAWKNKNPGNLKYVGQKRAIGADAQGFCIFKTYEDGFLTLKEMVQRAATGKSSVYKPDMTFVEFFKVYAPSSDGNYPEKYAAFVAERVGVRTDTKIKELV